MQAVALPGGGLEVTVRWFVPLGQTCEVWDVRVRNTTAAPKRASLWGYVEWCLWDAQDDATNFQRNFSTGQVEVEPGAIFHVTEYRERRNHFAYFSCSAPTAGFDTSRDAFAEAEPRLLARNQLAVRRPGQSGRRIALLRGHMQREAGHARHRTHLADVPLGEFVAVLAEEITGPAQHLGTLRVRQGAPLPLGDGCRGSRPIHVADAGAPRPPDLSTGGRFDDRGITGST